MYSCLPMPVFSFLFYKSSINYLKMTIHNLWVQFPVLRVSSRVSTFWPLDTCNYVRKLCISDNWSNNESNKFGKVAIMPKYFMLHIFSKNTAFWLFSETDLNHIHACLNLILSHFTPDTLPSLFSWFDVYINRAIQVPRQAFALILFSHEHETESKSNKIR